MYLGKFSSVYFIKTCVSGKEYKCYLCDYQTTSKDRVKKHKWSKHEGKEYRIVYAFGVLTGVLARPKVSLGGGVK